MVKTKKEEKTRMEGKDEGGREGGRERELQMTLSYNVNGVGKTLC
jgi:hypothetical protein